jgi:nucleoside-diphosphate-sugar epimerase
MPEGTAGSFPDPGVQVVFGSTEKPSRWLSALDRADVLFHAAPPTPGVSVLTGEDGWPVSSFTTGAMLGPGPITGSAVGSWISEFLRTGNIGPAFGGTCVVDARDVAQAMITASEIRARDEFVLAGHYVEYVELLEMLEELTGRKARPHGRVIARAGWPAGSARAVNELGSTFRPIEETLRDVIASHLPSRTAGLMAC